MNLTQAVKSRSYRTLRPLQGFRQLDTLPEKLKKQLESVAFDRDERPIGVYENHPGKLEELIVITTHALWVHRAPAWIPYTFRNIEAVTVPFETDKRDADSVLLTLSDGGQITLPVKGGNDRFRDAWEFSRFLSRVVDLHSAAAASRE
jgi:hypothetical protein